MIEIDYKDDKFNGIFAHFYKYYTNLTISKFVNVNASSIYSLDRCSFNIINPLISKTNFVDSFLSKSLENSSITFTFLKHNLALSSYSIKARQDQTNYNHPYEFVLEATNDNSHWIEIHHKQHDDTLQGTGKEGNWNCSNTNEFFHTFKLTMLKTNSYKHDYEKYIFAFSTIEFFGKLINTSPYLYGSKCIKCNNYNFLSYLFIIIH